MKPGGLIMTAALLAALGTGDGAAVAAGHLNKAQANGYAKPDSPGRESSPPQSGAALLNRGYLLGRWTDDGDCHNAIDLSPDGTFTTSTGARGLWTLDGDRLTMSGRTTLTIRIVPIDRNTITVINTDGSLGRSTRCPDAIDPSGAATL